LASFSIQRRTKEIGIRKILGASLSRIILLLTKEYVWLLVIANLVAWPVAYISMNRWLNDFAYQTDMSIWIFMAAGGAVLLIALATVSYHSAKAGRINPVESLRSE
ncbi:MAG: FtsX-like permease family protein, partial [Balneolaceae bacterium]|nr:FtsX-like permease family protein [Balneolaceae bacterium]